MSAEMKLNIFVSRPLDLPPELLEGFHARLRDNHLLPMTHGIETHSLKTPLDPTRKLMHKCQGAVIFGFPKDRSLFHGERRSQERNAHSSEWSHIEAAIACDRNMPVLVIADKTVGGGIFDRGAGNIFINNFDLMDPRWAWSKEFSGALSAFRSELIAPENSARIATIRKPIECAEVGIPCTVEGNAPSDAEVWLISHSTGDDKFWVHRQVYCRDGEWRVEARCGDQYWGSGRAFEFCALIRPEIPLKLETHYATWPPAKYSSAVRVVVRR